MAEWDTKYINDLPNSAFAVVEPDYLNGKTDNKNARHLPYKDASGKVDLPHLRNARARMNQIKPVTKSISTEELRAKAKKVLDAVAKKYLKESEDGGDTYSCECLECGNKFTSEDHCADSKCPKCGGKARRAERPGAGKLNEDIIHLSMDTPRKIELVDDNAESPTYKIKFELIDVGEYNQFAFSLENLDYMVKEFVSDTIGVVSHGLDHSRKTLEQLGKVYELKLEGSGGDAKVYAFSELYKETETQKQAYILFKQGLLNFVSGGWVPKRFVWNEEKNNIGLVEPKLKEISSTPVPAKSDAKALEVLNSLNQAPMEEYNMADENPNENNPSPEEGEEIVEQSDKTIALSKELQAELNAVKAARKEMEDELASVKAAKEQAEVATLMEKAKSLGLSEDLFKDKSPDAIKLALEAAKEIQVSELAKREPEITLGGADGTVLADGSEEMAAELEKRYFDWGDLKQQDLVV
jgi:rubrerythrin